MEQKQSGLTDGYKQKPIILCGEERNEIVTHSGNGSMAGVIVGEWGGDGNGGDIPPQTVSGK